MRITIIGGHGKIALLTQPQLLNLGHRVTGVIRNPDQVDTVRLAGAEPVVADIEQLDRDGIAELLKDTEAVIWSAGAGGGNPERTRAVDRDAAIRTIDAAQDAGVDRFVMVSYIGSGRDDVPEDNPFVHYARAKAEADAHLRASKLNWTILGPGALTDEPASNFISYGDHIDSGETSRANVAVMLTKVVARSDLAGATINFRDGRIPIPEALNSIARQVAGRPVAMLREGILRKLEPTAPDLMALRARRDQPAPDTVPEA